MRFLVAVLCLAARCAPTTETRAAAPPVDVAVADVPAGEASAATNEPSPQVAPRRAAPEPEAESARPPETPPGPGTSSTDLATARALFKEGVEAYANGDFPRAEALFGKAYAIAPKPQVLFNLGKVLLSEGKTREACATFERYWLTLSPPDPRKRADLPVAQCPNLANLP